jgi:hypothetical protein
MHAKDVPEERDRIALLNDLLTQIDLVDIDFIER